MLQVFELRKELGTLAIRDERGRFDPKGSQPGLVERIERSGSSELGWVAKRCWLKRDVWASAQASLLDQRRFTVVALWGGSQCFLAGIWRQISSAPSTRTGPFRVSFKEKVARGAEGLEAETQTVRRIKVAKFSRVVSSGSWSFGFNSKVGNRLFAVRIDGQPLNLRSAAW